jgi:hypothetical protein
MAMRESGRLGTLLGREGTLLLLADEDTSALALFDAESGRLLLRSKLECAPEQLLVASNGDVFVVETRCNRVSRHRISEIDGNFVIEEIDRAAVAVEPVSLGLSPDEATLFVVSAWGRTLTSLALPRFQELKRVALPREPRAVSTTDDGERIFVSHASGSMLSEVNPRDLAVSEHSLASRVVSRSFALHGGWHDAFFEFDTGAVPFRHHRRRLATLVSSHLHATQGFSLLARGNRVLLPEVLSNPGELGQVANGYGVTGSPLPPTLQDVAVFDLEQNQLNHAGTFAIIHGWVHTTKNVCRLPRAAAYDEERQSLLVACLGSGRVLEFDALARDPARTELRSFAVPQGPAAIAVEQVRRRAFVWSRFARSISVIDLGDGAPPDRPPEMSPAAVERRSADTPEGELLAAYPVPFGSESTPELHKRLLGMALFQTSNDARISRDGRACESCHPAGRDDGLAWRTGDQLAARQTPMLDGRIADTAPYGWLGQHDTLEQHLANAIHNRLQGQGLAPEEFAALTAHVRGLPGPPLDAPAVLGPSAARGKGLFHRPDVACADCHEAGTGVDGVQYAISGTTGTDTPSLRFVAGGAPFFHDGRFATLDALLRDTQGTMGQHVRLNDSDRADLVAFLESL